MNATTEHRSETELKAHAWDLLMSSKHPRCDDAVMDAWQWLKAARVANVKARLEELRAELRAERISYGELAELQGLAQYIEAEDVELLEAAGVPESEEEN